MTRLATRVGLLAVGALGIIPIGLDAQYRLARSPEWPLPTPWSPELAGSVVWPDQVERLPVYDDAGELIPFPAIQGRVDRSGLKGAFWGGLAGFTAGALVGAALTSYDCDRTSGGYYIGCSPREDALRSNVPPVLGLVGAVGFAWLGWNGDVTTWQEALSDVRRERRTGGGR